MTEESSVLPSLSKKDEHVACNERNINPDTEYFEQSTCPSNSDLRNVAERIRRGYKVKVKKGTNRIVLLRFLIAKLRFSIEGLSIEEFLLLNHLILDLGESKDPLFWEKHKQLLEKSESLIYALNKVRMFPVCSNEEGKILLDRIFDDKMLSPREYFGLAGQLSLRQSFKIVLQDALLPQRLPPKRFIGVGYKDKGTCRDPAWDGTPRWQETAQYLSNLEREAEELDSSFSDSLEDFEE